MTFNVFSQKNKQKEGKEKKEANYLASVGIFFFFFSKWHQSESRVISIRFDEVVFMCVVGNNNLLFLAHY